MTTNAQWFVGVLCMCGHVMDEQGCTNAGKCACWRYGLLMPYVPFDPADMLQVGWAS